MESGDSREICVISFRLRQSETIESFKLTSRRIKSHITINELFDSTPFKIRKKSVDSLK